MSLSDDDIVTTRLTGRRSFLARIGATIVGATGLLAISSSAQARDAKDSDSGEGKDDKDTDTKSVDTDMGRPPDSKLHDLDKRDGNPDHDTRERGDPK